MSKLVQAYSSDLNSTSGGSSPHRVGESPTFTITIGSPPQSSWRDHQLTTSNRLGGGNLQEEQPLMLASNEQVPLNSTHEAMHLINSFPSLKSNKWKQEHIERESNGGELFGSSEIWPRDSTREWGGATYSPLPRILKKPHSCSRAGEVGRTDDHGSVGPTSAQRLVLN